MEEKTLVLIKPNGLIKSLTGNIITALSETKLRVVGAKIVKVPREIAELHYSESKNKNPEIFDNVIDYLMGKHHNTPRVFALVYKGEDAIKKLEKFVVTRIRKKPHQFLFEENTEE